MQPNPHQSTGGPYFLDSGLDILDKTSGAMQFGVPATHVEYAPCRSKGLASAARWLKPKSPIRTYRSTADAAWWPERFYLATAQAREVIYEVIGMFPWE
jgi:hypothetical protein